MSRKFAIRIILLKAYPVLLVIEMLLLIAGLSVAADQTFCGTKRCSAGREPTMASTS